MNLNIMKTISREISGGVATLTLNRPDVMNALNVQMTSDLLAAVSAIRTDESIRCVVLRGAGGNFMAGGDVEMFRESLACKAPGERLVPEEVFDNVNLSIIGLRSMPQPVIASVEGMVVGYGLSLMNACDLVIAAENSTYASGYSRIGASPDGGGSFFLTRIVGVKRALEMIMLDERYDARQMQVYGLVNRVVPVAELEAETAKVVERLLAGPAVAYAQSKKLVNMALTSSLEEHLAAEEQSFLHCGETSDFAEGVNAFCQKRKAQFGPSSSALSDSCSSAAIKESLL